MGSFTRFDVYENELRVLLADELDRLKDEMATGLLKSFEDYRHVTGKIVGLRTALELMDEAANITNKKIGA